MDVTEAIETRIEVREYEDRLVDMTTKRAILEAGRLAPSGRNRQHWHFVLVEGPGLEGLAERSPSGGWVADAAFAVVVLTDPTYSYNGIDAGRAITHMQFAAWERGVGSCIYTVDDPRVEEFLAVPDDLEVTAVIGFGFPAREVRGLKDREPLDEIASAGRVGEPLELE